MLHFSSPTVVTIHEYGFVESWKQSLWLNLFILGIVLLRTDSKQAIYSPNGIDDTVEYTMYRYQYFGGLPQRPINGINAYSGHVKYC